MVVSGELGAYLRSEFLAHGSLLIATVDRNGTKSHCLGVLQSQRSESTSGADNGDSLAGTGSRLLQSLVDGDTGTEDRSDSIKGNFLGKLRRMTGLGDGILLERTIDGVAG